MEQIKEYYKLAKEHKKITMGIVIVVIMLIALIN
tara:strand:- start:215 stop:316 length:102 start_codon:yes stop_codon:yes gene_type:complete